MIWVSKIVKDTEQTVRIIVLQKNVVDDLIYKTDVEEKYMDTKGKSGGGMNQKIGIDTFNIMYKIDNG